MQVFPVDEGLEQQGQLSPELQSITNTLLPEIAGMTNATGNLVNNDVGKAVLGGGAAVAVAPVIISGLGFTSSGIAAGSIGAAIMSTEAILFGGGVPSWGLTAALQSAGAVGMGMAMASGVFGVGALGAYGIAKALQKSQVFLGYLTGPAFFRDGSIISIYSSEHGRFLSLTQDKKVSAEKKIPYNKLSKDLDCERFLVVGNVSSNVNEFALYSISNKCFMRLIMDSGDNLVGGSHSIEEGDPTQEEIFQVGSNDKGQFTLFSPLLKKYVRIHPNGNADCGAVHPSSWEHLVLIVVAVTNP